MKKGDILALIVLIALSSIEVILYAITEFKPLVDEGHLNPHNLVVPLIVFFILPFIVIAIIVIIRIVNNTSKKHILTYASKSVYLLKKTNIHESLFTKKEINTNKTVEEKEAEEDLIFKKQAKMRMLFSKFTLYMATIIAFALIVGVCLGLASKSFNQALIFLSIYFLIIFAICFIIIQLNYPKNKVFFSDEKIQAIKDFDAVDDSLQIVDYKIYKNEMYMELPFKEKKVYVLINKRDMYVLTINARYIKKSSTYNIEEEDEDDTFYSFKEIDRISSIKTYYIRFKDINEIMEILRDSIINK